MVVRARVVLSVIPKRMVNLQEMRLEIKLYIGRRIQEMKKTILGLTIMVVAAAMVAAFSSPASAAVTGVCSDCHTMHNSQGGSGMEISGTGPFSTLLRGSCAGCHAQGTENHVEGSIPQVYHTSGTNLAGGNFGYIDATVGSGASDTKGHNVICIDADITGDANLSAPPGDEFTTGIASGASSPDFTCAGEKGCHGNRATADEAASVSGAHHGDDTTIDGNSVATSYRFLLGVLGVENNGANPWRNITGGDHNKYQGADKGDTQDTSLGKTNPGDAGTISGLCGECHGDFHGTGVDGMGTASGTWIRHPTDILLPNTVPYSGYNPVTNFDATVPVAYTVPGTPARLQAVVMCLSCHGVHGTDYTDILRWDYTGISAGGGESTTGCFRCHMDKD